jgi:hypothetical protein
MKEDIKQKQLIPAIPIKGLPDSYDEPRLFHEINLLRIEGYYFCLSPKLAAKISGKQEFTERFKTSDRVIERAIAIEPNPTYGYPSPLAYKVLQAILKKLSDYGYPVSESVSFSQRELAALAGRRSFGGMTSKQFLKAIMQLKSTLVWCSFYVKNTDEWQSTTFTLLNRVLLSGKKTSIQKCVFYVEPLVIESLNNRYAFCLNYARMERLEPISMALFKRLFYHFSNIYGLKQSSDFSFKKDYADICSTWLGGLKVLKHKSRILNDQLSPHVKGLKAVGLIKKFEIEKNKISDGFNLVFYPGSAFFEDYERFYLAKQGQLQFKLAKDKNLLRQSLELVSYFYRRLYDTDELDAIIFSNKETDLAGSLLQKYSYLDVRELIDYAIREARNTSFDIKSFGALKLYITPFLSERERRAARKAKEQQMIEYKQEQEMQDEYSAFRNGEIARIIGELAPQELDALIGEVRAMLLEDGTNPICFDLMTRIRTDALITKRYRVPSFEEWRRLQK